MTTYWLRNELRTKSNAVVSDGDRPLKINVDGRIELIYCPDQHEYRITCDVVKSAKDLNTTIIAYAESWCGPTLEGEGYAKELNITVMPFRSLFAYLKRKGIIFRE